MNQAILTKEYPEIAQALERIINDPQKVGKYRSLAYNYRTENRGLSLERVFAILKENNIRLCLGGKWYDNL